MRTYLLNTPVLTAYGEYRFNGPLDVEAARRLLAAGFHSAVGHRGAAQLLQALFGVAVPVNRVRVEMAPGDRAIVLRLLERLEEGRVLSADEIREVPYEFALLERVS